MAELIPPPDCNDRPRRSAAEGGQSGGGMKRTDVCVLLPAFNEERNILRVVREVQELGFPVVVVDDGSTDQTRALVEPLGVNLLALGTNQGKGACLRRGCEWILNNGDFQALILMDADGQHDPKELPLFLEALNKESLDLVIGNRMKTAHRMPWLRRATNRFLSWFLSRFIPHRVLDSQCGYRAIRRRLLEKISLRSNHFEIESEMLLEAARLGAAIGSVPVRCLYAGEKSQIHPVHDTLRFVGFLYGYFVTRRRMS